MINLYADDGYIDTYHDIFSTYIRNVGSSLDRGTSGLFDSKDDNVTVEQERKNIDTYFQNKKYIDETRKAYIRLRNNNAISSKSTRTNDFNINAQIPLDLTNKRFNLFINDTQDEFMKNSANTKTNNDKAVGINFFTSPIHAIQSKYSLGIRATQLFVRARYSRVFTRSLWKIEPTQEFKYATKDNFTEESNIYFDRALDERSLFRITLHRGTQEHNPGMDYNSYISYYKKLASSGGYSITQSFNGNTDYYNGFYEYATSFNWRDNIFRKWIFYNVQPIVSFHKDYSFDANYILQLNLEFYFGGDY